MLNPSNFFKIKWLDLILKPRVTRFESSILKKGEDLSLKFEPY